MRDFNSLVFFSIMCLYCIRHFTRVRKNCDFSGAAFMFSFCNI